MKNFPIIIIVAVIIAGAAGFFGGMKYQQGQAAKALVSRFGTGINGTGTQRTGGGANRFGNGNNRPIIGQIVSSDATSITVKLTDGSSKIVLISQTTTINKAAAATISDLTTGQVVSAFGTPNADGSITAQNIQLNPTNLFRGEGGTPPAPGN